MEQLIRRCRAGEDQAIATLIGRFRTHALDLASALLTDEHLAEDAVQEAFITALRRLDDLREPSAFPGWFRQIVRTECNRILRKRRERLQPETEETAGDAPSALEHVEQSERRAQVRAALASLPPVSRQTAELFYLEELKCADIATRLQVPAGTVKRRLHDARAQLRAMLLGHVPGSGTAGAATATRTAGLPL